MDERLQNLMNNFKNPQNYFEMEDFTHKFKKNNSNCGDSFELFLKVNNENVIEKASFTGKGCSISTSGFSLITEFLIGKKINEINEKDFLDFVGVSLNTNKKKCLLMSYESIKNNKI